jgi:uncharacterized protein (TIGR02466 family)
MNTNKLIDVTPWEPMIIKAHFDGFNQKELIPICEQMIKNSPLKIQLEQGDAFSSVSNETMPHTMNQFKPFYNWLLPVVNHIIHKEWGIVNDWKFGISNSWVNVHKKGGITIEHEHGQTTLVAAAYLNLPKDGGFIQFKDPLEYLKAMRARPESSDRDFKTIPAITGDVFLFPGWVRHRTQPNNSDEDRWVITTNVISKTIIK